MKFPSTVRSTAILLLLGLVFWGSVGRADETSAQPDQKPASSSADGKEASAKKKTAGSEQPVVTTHAAVIEGKEIEYSATAGKLPARDEKGEVKGNIFYVAYTRTDVEQPERRPLSFCFNGGPGSSSVWLHLGMLGPRRVKLPDDASTLKPPYQLHDNPHSLLDVTDLVFIDPVSTGYSRPASDKTKGEFHGYDEDIRSVAQFIHDYTTKYERWASPKFLVGESYGGVRAAGLASHLRQRFHLELNGIVVISGAIDFQTLRFNDGNDLPYVTFLPTYTATAWYHKALPGDLRKLPLREVVKRSEQFAQGDYLRALFLGAELPDEERESVVEQYARLTGLSKEFVDRADLRVTMSRFGKELLRSRGRTVGRFDSRYQGIDRDNVGDSYEYDPSGAAIFGPFTAALNQYMRQELQYEDPGVYEILTGKVHPWSYSRFENRYVNASESLRQAMTANPHLKLFVACGYYDLATPHFAMEHTLRHLGLIPQFQKNIAVGYYEGGHMMYIHEPSMKQLRADLKKFYRSAS